MDEKALDDQLAEAQRRVRECERLITKQKVSIFFRVIFGFPFWREGKALEALEAQQAINRSDRDRLAKHLGRTFTSVPGG